MNKRLERCSGLLPILLLGVQLMATSATAQDSELQLHIDQAVTALLRLDSLANSCLQALENDTETMARQACAAFMDGVDGELMAQYLSHCQALKSWRDAYVNRAFNTSNDSADSSTAEQDLRFLVGTDYACGSDALQQRTEFVTTAFGLLQSQTRENQHNNAALDRRLAEQEFDASLNAERRLLLNSVQQQRQRREMETARQMNQLENELIRQQINRPNQ